MEALLSPVSAFGFCRFCAMADHCPVPAQLRTSPRLTVLFLFQTLHGVGAKTARELYDLYSCRTLQDVLRIRPELDVEIDRWGELQLTFARRISVLFLQPLSTDAHLLRIPRAEVEEIARRIHGELEKISKPGSVYTICGGEHLELRRRVFPLVLKDSPTSGYRRGKPFSNDVDIIFSHPSLAGANSFVSKGTLERLIANLRASGSLSPFLTPCFLR